MNKLFAILIFFAGFPIAMLSQTTPSKVGVNTRTPTEVLHVEGTARVQELPKNGTDNSIYTKGDGTSSAAKDQTFTAEKMVVADKNGVLGSIRGLANWFYMPSINIPTDPVGPNKEIDLYEAFKTQFQTPKVKSPSAPAIIPNLPAKTELFYYITDYDEAVLENVSVDANGKMKYDVKAAPTETSYINIVFLLK